METDKRDCGLDTLGELAKNGKDFGAMELAGERKELVRLKANKALRTLRSLGVSEDVEIDPLSPVLRMVKSERANASGDTVKEWEEVLHTVSMVKYYVALANGESPTIGDEDILASDMDEDTLKTLVSSRLNINYLEAYTGAPDWTGQIVSGILWGYQSRPFYALTVGKRDKVFLAPFFSDSGSKMNYLNEGTFAALGFTESIPETATVRIHGYSVQVALATGPVKGVNTIGADFKRTVGGVETLDYTQDVVQLKRSNPGV